MADEPQVTPPLPPRGINAFVLNLIVPGLGALYSGHLQPGAMQLGLFLLGLLVVSGAHVLGAALIAGAWIWSARYGYRLLTGN